MNTSSRQGSHYNQEELLSDEDDLSNVNVKSLVSNIYKFVINNK